ncbi:MAG TPA: hypothetical protein VFP72_13220 [Kineosporiaceae bacterium]|nr:hypothetical protein [Kineosporiaceae bacterium]
MGFWGVTVVARSAGDLDGLASVRALGGEVDWVAQGQGGWRFLRRHGAEWPPDAVVQAVADEVAGPVLCAYIIDSDAAHVRLAAPGQELFEFVLNERGAAIYDVPVDPRVQAQVPQHTIAPWRGPTQE